MSDSSNDGKAKVLQAVDIVELIGQAVKLRRRGTKYVGLCPFHQEKTPSFTVDPAKQFFYCHGCKAGGDVFSFVMKRDRVEFGEALQTLARHAGIDLPRFSGTKQNSSERQVLLEAHSAACGLFEKLLAHPQIGEAARAYLANRGFTAETIQKFQIGFVPAGWDTLLKSQAMKKFMPEQLFTAGLVKSREGNDGYYDTFRNRIMFPIRDEQGRIIAFGGRVMPGSDDPAKYLNSPETPLFAKGRCIYGIDFARQKVVETRSVAVVEGYTDVVMAHQYGATNVVSVLGTAMTEQHVAILRRFSDRIVLLFDADTAGDLAVNRAVELFLSQPVEIAIASMPDGVDPDEYLMQHGLQGFEKLLAEGQDALAYKWRQLLRNMGEKKDLTSQQKAVEDYLALLAGARGAGPVDPIRWGSILTRVSRLTEIPVDQLNGRFKVKKKRPAAQAAAPVGANGNPGSPAAAPPKRAATARDRAERWVMGALLAEPSRWSVVQVHVSPTDFGDADVRRLADVFWTRSRDESEPAFNDLLGLIDDEPGRQLAVSLLDEAQAMENMEQMLADAIGHLQQIQQRADQQKLVAELRQDSPDRTADVEADLLRKLIDKARQPDIRRAAT